MAADETTWTGGGLETDLGLRIEPSEADLKLIVGLATVLVAKFDPAVVVTLVAVVRLIKDNEATEDATVEGKSLVDPPPVPGLPFLVVGRLIRPFEC